MHVLVLEVLIQGWSLLNIFHNGFYTENGISVLVIKMNFNYSN